MQLSGHRLDNHGIRPLESDGLGIIFAPLLHANWQHPLANTGPALILGSLMTLVKACRGSFRHRDHLIVGGFGTWLIGGVGAHCPTSECTAKPNHIGARD